MKMEKKINTLETKNGVTVWIRPLLSEDAPLLVNLFEHMSSDSRYSRFHQPLDHVAPERLLQEAEAIAHMPEQVGFIAFADLPNQSDAPIGVARYVCLGDEVAETAVSVRDDMQNQGVGNYLIHLLADQAKQHGVKTFVATVQNSNRAIIHILNQMPYPLTSVSNGPDSELKLHLLPL